MKVAKSTLTPAELEAKAHALAGAEKWAAASQTLLKAAHAEPRNTARWLQVARWQRQNREPQQAERTIQKALTAYGKSRGTDQEQDAADFQALCVGLLEAQLDQQDWGACQVTAKTILQNSPRHHFALEILATAQLHSGQIDEAAEVMQMLLLISPRDPLHRLKYATLLQLQGRSGASLEEFSRVLQSYPDAPFASDAHDAIELLDTMQIQQILIRASEQEIFRLQLQRAFDETLQQHGFHLSENGRESLRHMIDDGRIDTDPKPIQIH